MRQYDAQVWLKDVVYPSKGNIIFSEYGDKISIVWLPISDKSKSVGIANKKNCDFFWWASRFVG
jgi:hypothetical protein